MRVKVKIPTSINDIKLSQYQKFLKTTKDVDDVNWINRQSVAIFCNLPDEYVDKIRKKDYDDILNTLNKLLSEQPELELKINYKGAKYGFIPDLENITVGEQADLETLISDWQKMDKAMAVLYRPIENEFKGRYEIAEYTSKEEPLDLPLGVVLGAYAFFLNLLNDLQSYIQNSIQQLEIQNRYNEILAKNGDGTPISMPLHKVIYSNLKRLVS